jgi:hypothetical protein
MASYLIAEAEDIDIVNGVPVCRPEWLKNNPLPKPPDSGAEFGPHPRRTPFGLLSFWLPDRARHMLRAIERWMCRELPGMLVEFAREIRTSDHPSRHCKHVVPLMSTPMERAAWAATSELLARHRNHPMR